MTTLLVDLFSWILSVSAMASVLAIIIFTAKWLLKERLKPRWAYLLWMLLALRLLLPWTPESSLSVFNMLDMEVAADEFYASAAEPLSQINKTAAQTNQPATATVQVKPVSPMQIGAWLWLIGAVSLLGYIFTVNLRFAWKVKQEPKLYDPEIRTIFERCKHEMKVTRTIALIKTNLVSSPTLLGVFKPKLLLPESALCTLNEEQLRYVFLHELSHVQRNDVAANWIMNVLIVLHWFNPLLWYAYHKMREDQEVACDALALTRINPEDSRNYALTIITLLETITKPVRLASAASISGNMSVFKKRISMISTYTKNSYRWSLFGFAVIILLSGFVLTDAKSAATPETVVDGYFHALGEKKRETQKYVLYSVILEHDIQEMKDLDGKKVATVEVKFEHRQAAKYRAIGRGSAVYELTLNRSGDRWVIESVISRDVKYKRNDILPMLF
ncbi:M56 family metallopeptidase [Paenibacillus thermotolerans]|uniref:M56 family metallopeptidase n=1 Tax=Paenibacillus thermotolerans TaxID=3027807 RepID=UPI0023686E7B|nr:MULTISPECIES: M56 family metallopeptidase [unclassified Paenibacillus]